VKRFKRENRLEHDIKQSLFVIALIFVAKPPAVLTETLRSFPAVFGSLAQEITGKCSA
jgi:hypothetical protein